MTTVISNLDVDFFSQNSGVIGSLLKNDLQDKEHVLADVLLSEVAVKSGFRFSDGSASALLGDLVLSDMLRKQVIWKDVLEN